jgi:CubicO group peptidase (beta-lactamase class C family)
MASDRLLTAKFFISGRSMKFRRLLTGLVLIGGIGAGAVLVYGQLRVAVGYSAKQLCSGVFVSGFSPRFVLETDVLPRLEAFGPAGSLLDIRVDTAGGFADASMLGVRSRATHRYETGCTLFGEGPGQVARPLPQAEEPVGVPPDLEDAFEDAFDEPSDGGRNTLALLVSYRGQLIAEEYAGPVTTATPLQGWSMNKSLMATWIGMRVADGAIDPTVSVTITDPTLPRATPQDKGLDPRLTLLHLLQMESGIDFGEVYGIGGDATRMFYRTEAMWTVPANQGHSHAPGQNFYYSSGDTVLASYLWQRSLDEPYTQWIEKNFREPLGLSVLVAEPDASGVQVGSSFAFLTARDWLRVGELWLDAWHGRSDLLSTEWLRASVRPRPSDPRGQYGRGFWLNTGGVAFRAMPESLFYASGNSGQYVLIVPEWELIVVRLGLTEDGSRTGVGDFLRTLASMEREGALEALLEPEPTLESLEVSGP